MTEEEARARARERIERSKAKRNRQLRRNIAICAAAVAVLLLGIAGLIIALRRTDDTGADAIPVADVSLMVGQPEMEIDLLPVNPYSRPGDELKQVSGVVVHYTGNPGTTARQNRNYFANLAETHETSVSSHFVVGLEGEIIQCVPCDEIAYASNERNKDTISIECCIADDSGRFNPKTYQSLTELTAWLMCEYELDSEDILRHYDVTGKKCPKYFVEHEGAWRAFKEDIKEYIDENGQRSE